MRLKDKVAIITGGAHGMGESTARIFAREGAKVVIADVLEREGGEVAASIRAGGGDALFVRLDVAQEDQWPEVVRTTVARHGRLDVLVNNAGISGAVPDRMSTEYFDQLMAVNTRGTFLGMKYAIPEMQKASRGSIVNFSSISGFVGQEFVHMGYNAAKGAIRLLTKSAAAQYGKDGIRVNSVHPGIMPPMRTSVTTCRPGPAREIDRVDPAAAGRQDRRGGVRSAVPRLRRGFLHHRHRAGGGRRVPGGVNARVRPVGSK